MPESPVASVVVATHQRVVLLPRLVRALEAQQGSPPFELIVVDDASTDGTWDVLRQLTASSRVPVRPLRMQRNSGPAAARNLGWRAGRGSLIAFTDDDCVPQPGWLAALAETLAGAELVQGQTLPDPAQASHCGPFSRTQEVRGENGYYQACNIGYRKALLERIGGFDERLRSGEDTELAWRARAGGARSAFAPAALVLHDVRPSSFTAHLKDTRRWEGVVLAVRLHPGLRRHLHHTWFWKDSHPPAMTAALGLAMLACRGRWSARRLLALTLLAPYVRYRVLSNPLGGGPRRRLAAMPAALVVDLAEVLVMGKASLRYRTLLL